MTTFRTNAVAAAALVTLAAGVGPAAAGTPSTLEGSWTVARATMNGVTRVDSRVPNSTWTCHGSELVMQNTRGERSTVVPRTSVPGRSWWS